MKFIQKNLLLTASGIAVFVIFHTCYGWQTLLPSNISWLMTMKHDWGMHYLGWHFYKNEAWQFPIGQINNYFSPIGTNVGFTDSIPLFALFLKPFARVLPEDFQYLGLWLFLCHLLTAYYTIRLFNLFKVSALFTFIAVLFIAANPVLIYRGLHPALCAHWLLIAGVYVYFLDPHIINKNKILLHQFILLMISALVNPYLCFMVLGFTFIIPLKLFFFNGLKAVSVLKYLAGSIGSLLFIFYIVGLITIGKKEDLAVSGGYGIYGLNLNALFNPQGFSSYLPQLKWVSSHQYEGFMYMGMGMYFLVFVLLIYGLFSFVNRKNAVKIPKTNLSFNHIPLLPLICLMILFTLFSITHVVTLNDKVLFTIPIPKVMISLGEIFRASARFFWTPYYLIVFIIILGITGSTLKVPVKLAILLVALIIQFYDTRLMLTYRHLTHGAYEPQINSNNWRQLMKEFDEIVFYPPFQATYLTNMDYQQFCYLAAIERKPINIGYLARTNYSAMRSYSDSIKADLEKGKLFGNKLYVTTLSNLQHFSFALQTGSAKLNILDNYCYLYTAGKDDKKLSMLSNTFNEINRDRIDSASEKFSKKVSFAKTNKFKATENDNITYFIEKDRVEDNYIMISGWAFIKSSQRNKGDSTFLVLEGEKGIYSAPAKLQERPDITSYFKRPYLDDAGFNALITTDSVQKGLYMLGIGIKNKTGKVVYQLTKKQMAIGVPAFPTEKKATGLPPYGDIAFNAEVIEMDSTDIRISGWAFYRNQGANGCKISVVLKNNETIYILPAEVVLRPDVTAAFKGPYNLDNSGFTVKIMKRSIDKGNYQLGIQIKDLKKRFHTYGFYGQGGAGLVT